MEIIDRKTAMLLDYMFYFTGKPCKHGHMARRYVKSRVCEECRKVHTASEYFKKYYLENKETIDNKNKEYAQLHKEHIKEKQKDYYSRNRDKVRNNVKLYATENPEKVKLAKRKNYLNNREQHLKKM